MTGLAGRHPFSEDRRPRGRTRGPVALGAACAFAFEGRRASVLPQVLGLIFRLLSRPEGEQACVLAPMGEPRRQGFEADFGFGESVPAQRWAKMAGRAFGLIFERRCWARLGHHLRGVKDRGRCAR